MCSSHYITRVVHLPADKFSFPQSYCIILNFHVANVLLFTIMVQLSQASLLTNYEKCKKSEGEDSDSDSINLKRELGLLGSTAYIVGGVIGTGIFISPKGVAQYSGSVGLALIIWVFGGVLSFVGCLCYAELGTTWPESGGDYIYVKKTFGHLASFVYLWVELIVRQPTSQAIRIVAVAKYILRPIFPDTTAPFVTERLLGAVFFCCLTSINFYRVRWGTCFQVITTVAKLFALGIIIIVGFVELAKGNNKSLENAFSPPPESLSSVALALYASLYAYTGWDVMNFATEEIKNPVKTLPRSIFLSLFIITIVYVFANLGYFSILSFNEIISVDAVAVVFGERVLGVMAWVIPIFVSISVIGSLNTSVFTCSRIYFVGSRDRHLPALLSMINIHWFTPQPALIFNALMALIMLSVSDLGKLITYYIFIRWGMIAFSIASLIWVKIKEPNKPKPIKFPIIIPILFLLACLFLVIMPFYQQPLQSIIGVALCASGFPVYFLVNLLKKKTFFCRILNKFTIFCQKTFLIVNTEGKQDNEEESVSDSQGL